MDQVLIPPRTASSGKLLIAAAVIAVALVVGYLISRPTGLRLDPSQLSVATVTQDRFYEYINLDGTVQPSSTYVIDSKIAGNVDRLYATSGQEVRRGDTLLRIANADLELEVMQRESQLIEQLNNQRQTRLLLDQNDFNRREQLTEVTYQLALQQKQYERDRDLAEGGILAQSEFDFTANRYEYYRSRRKLLAASFRADSSARAVQLRQLGASERRILTNLSRVRSILDRLYLLAATDGRLGDFSVRTGEAVTNGQRLGEIYDLGRPLLVAEVDEFYLDKITVGQSGVLADRADTVRLTVAKIYPTVNAGRFRIDATLDGDDAVITQLVRGQTLRFRLFFGRERSSVLLPNGPFYASTGGHWVYRVLNGEAVRTPVRLGRSNPNHYEVLEGLSPGDRVVVSGYDGFSDYPRITLNSIP